MKDDKNYDGWNNAHEQKIFEQELKKDIVLWEKSGMSKSQINEMIEFEKQIFKSRRRYYTHNYTLFRLDSIIDTAIDTSDYKPINDFDDLSDYVSDERLIKAFKRYPTFKDISVLLAQGYDIKSIAKILNKTPNAIHIILFKVRKMNED